MRRHFGINASGAKPAGLREEPVDPNVTDLAVTFVPRLACVRVCVRVLTTCWLPE
jgi:hypothetical protein